MLLRFFAVSLCLLVLGSACSDTSSSKSKSRLSIEESSGGGNPVITVTGPFFQGDVLKLFIGGGCQQGRGVRSLAVRPDSSNVFGKTVEITHEGGDVGKHRYSVSVSNGVKTQCLAGTVQYSKLPGEPTSIIAAKALGFDAAVKVTVEGALVGGAVLLYSDAGCSSEVARSDGVVGSSVNVDVMNLEEKVHSFYGIIEKNNVSSVCSTLFGSYDRRPGPNFEFNPDLGSVSNKVAFVVSGEKGISQGDSVTFYKDSSCGSAVGTAVAAVAGSVTANIDLSVVTAVEDGPQRLYVQVVDGAGDELPCVDSNLSYSLDRAIGTVSGLSLLTLSPSSESRPSFTLETSGTVALGDTMNLYQESSCSGSIAATSKITSFSGSLLLKLSSSLSPSAAYPFSARMTDPAGNESACIQLASSYQYDSTLSTPPSIGLAVPSSSLGTVSTPNFQVSGVASGDIVKVYKGAGCSEKVGQVTATGPSESVTIASLASDGRYFFYATRTPSSGTESSCSFTPAIYELDTTAPGTPGVALVGTSPGNNPTPTVRVSQVVQDDRVEVYTDSICAIRVGGPVLADATSVDVTTSSLSDATYTFSVKVSDRAGNSSSCTAVAEAYQLDTVPPAIPTVELVTRTPDTDIAPVIKVSGVVAGDIIKLYKAANCLGEVGSGTVVAGDTSIDLTSSALSERGDYTFSAKAFDMATNESSCSAGVPYSLEGKRAFLSKMSAGDTHTCALSSQGGVYCWGRGNEGQIGNGGRRSVGRPTEVILEKGSTNPLSGIIQVSSGKNYSCSLTSGGEVRCWGHNFRGALGNNASKGTYKVSLAEQHESAPVKVVGSRSDTNPLTGIVQISSGTEHVCALTSEGKVKCWGSDCGVGQLGQGGYCSLSRTSPVDVQKSQENGGTGSGGALEGIIQVSSGGEHTCALSISGQVWCWGKSSDGQLAQATGVSVTRAKLVTSLSGITQMSAGEYHTCGLNTAGNVKCWGAGSAGRLGHNSETGGEIPVSVVGIGGKNLLENIVQISSGKEHTCSLDSDGRVMCWGKGSDGQLGNSTSIRSLVPVLVLEEGEEGASPLMRIVQISAGAEHTCALQESGDVKCWGKGNDGRLGYGGSENKNFPIPVLATSASTESSLLFNSGSYLRGYSCSDGACGFDDISLSLSSPTSSPGASASVTVGISGYSLGDRVSLYSDASCARTTLGSVTTATSGTVGIIGLSEGFHRFYFQVTSSGMSSACSSSFLSYVMDITPPNPPTIAINGHLRGFSKTPTISVLGLEETGLVRIYKGDSTCSVENKVGEAHFKDGRVEVMPSEEKLASSGDVSLLCDSTRRCGK